MKKKKKNQGVGSTGITEEKSARKSLCLISNIEELSMKSIDRPSVTEIERGGVYEMNRWKKCQPMEMTLKWIICNNTF